MMEFAIELENVSAKFARIHSLLAVFAREFIDITQEEMEFETKASRELIVGMHGAIMELTQMYIAETNKTSEVYHAKALEARK